MSIKKLSLEGLLHGLCDQPEKGIFILFFCFVGYFFLSKFHSKLFSFKSL